MQGARLTAWELVREGINTTGHHREHGRPAHARRARSTSSWSARTGIAANGDTANKIGTYTVAVMAKEHNIPFYVAAPLSTIDLSTPDGRSHSHRRARSARSEPTSGRRKLTPVGAHIRNPAFDVTPFRYITGIITERGILRPPYSDSLKQAFSELAGA
jgi:methylthioribose-1-phosphate isomerase